MAIKILKSNMPPPFMTMPYQGKKIRVQHGGSIFSGIWDGLKKAYNWVKDNGVASKIATAVGRPDVAAVTKQLGFRKKKRPTMPKQVAGRKTKRKNALGVAVLSF